MEIIFERQPLIKRSKNGEHEIIYVGTDRINLESIFEYGNENEIDFQTRISEISSFTGLFVLEIGDKIQVITDRIRSIPAFIFKKNGEFIVTDDLKNIPDKKLNSEKVAAFLSSTSPFGNDNCYENVFTCQAGEIATIEDGNISSERYFGFVPDFHAPQKSASQFVAEFNEVMESTIEHMVKSAPGVNNWVVPLSGGHDSRIIVNSLLKAGVKNVICYSYGTPGNVQSKISKRVTEAAGYKWYFVEYTEQKWSDLHRLGLINNYIDFSAQGVSVPHLQDFLAVHELKKLGILKDGDVFLPGHALDFLAGSHLTEIDLIIDNKQKSVERILKKMSKSEIDKEFLKDIILQFYDNFQGHPSQFQEYVNWQERQSKFIVNSCRVYEFFGFDFQLPFWDRKFVEFWMQISPCDRLNRNLFLKSEREGILLDELAAIPFEDEVTSDKLNKSLLQRIKNYIPVSLKVALLRLSAKKITLAEGMNQIYAKQGESVDSLIGPLSDFPKEIRLYIKPFLKRYPFQMNPHELTALYTIRRAIDKQKSDNM